MYLNTLQKYLNTVIKYKLKNVFKYILKEYKNVPDDATSYFDEILQIVKWNPKF